MRILFATTRGAGHVGPLIPFARAAVVAGHDVLFAGPGEAERAVRRAGFAFADVGEPDAETVRRAWAPVWSPGTSPGMLAVVQELFIGLHARTALNGMLEAIARFRPDVVVRETLEFSSALAAERLGVPQVRVGIHLDSDTDADPRLLIGVAAPALDELRPGIGLERDPTARAIGASPLLTLAPASTSGRAPALRFRDTTPAPRAELPDWGDPEEPLVYVSFGSETATSHHFPHVYRRAAEALATLPVRVLMTIGDRRDPAELGPLPPSTRAERWVPQAAALARASAAVGHGGSGSTLAALAAGLPQALVPLFVDGPANAARVEALGAGIALPDGPEMLAGAVAALLTDPGHRVRARAIAEEIAALPPVGDALAVLDAAAAQHAATRRRDAVRLAPAR